MKKILNKNQIKKLFKKEKTQEKTIKKNIKNLDKSINKKINFEDKEIKAIEKNKEKLDNYQSDLKQEEYKDITRLKRLKGKDIKIWLKWLWWFIWESNSIWSWILNIILAFIIIKFLVYPGLGFVFQTTHPVVAVVSGSMEHDGSFVDWWSSPAICINKKCFQKEWYENQNITKINFKSFSFKNGFNKGDIIILRGTDPKNIKQGDVIVFYGRLSDPIIHRVIKIIKKDNKYYFKTKGDHNMDQDNINITEEMTVGYEKYEKTSKAVFRIPLLGYIKICFVKLLKIFGITKLI